MSKDEFIEFELKHSSKAPMAAGKFLVPELCKYKGITLEDLKDYYESIILCQKRN